MLGQGDRATYCEQLDLINSRDWAASSVRVAFRVLLGFRKHLPHLENERG